MELGRAKQCGECKMGLQTKILMAQLGQPGVTNIESYRLETNNHRGGSGGRRLDVWEVKQANL